MDLMRKAEIIQILSDNVVNLLCQELIGSTSEGRTYAKPIPNIPLIATFFISGI